ncbi:hypothetical protein [Streptomyces sp. NPDC096324]|uniref:hypothetical protein n=1 Tax=Streptomyces sp. NPDC096324 TaxID=3366085 RepID=UPI0038182AE4
MHLLPDSRALGCDYPGAHVHVRRGENGAWSKSRHAWVALLDFLVVSALDLYYEERYRLLGSGGSALHLPSSNGSTSKNVALPSRPGGHLTRPGHRQ